MRKTPVLFLLLAAVPAFRLEAGTAERAGLVLFAEPAAAFGILGEVFPDRVGGFLDLSLQARIGGRVYAEILTGMGGNPGVQVSVVPRWISGAATASFLKLGLTVGRFGEVPFIGVNAGAGIERRLKGRVYLRLGGTFLLGMDSDADFSSWLKLGAGLGVRLK